jgi:hypothetical protein
MNAHSFYGRPCAGNGFPALDRDPGRDAHTRLMLAGLNQPPAVRIMKKSRNYF